MRHVIALCCVLSFPVCFSGNFALQAQEKTRMLQPIDQCEVAKFIREQTNGRQCGKYFFMFDLENPISDATETLVMFEGKEKGKQRHETLVKPFHEIVVILDTKAEKPTAPVHKEKESDEEVSILVLRMSRNTWMEARDCLPPPAPQAKVTP